MFPGSEPKGGLSSESGIKERKVNSECMCVRGREKTSGKGSSEGWGEGGRESGVGGGRERK